MLGSAIASWILKDKKNRRATGDSRVSLHINFMVEIIDPIQCKGPCEDTEEVQSSLNDMYFLI